ncbi:DNA recombination protein RmuC [Raineyella antarctica]|uniref:DNA recombination protein RmuC n=1 Tax=Raineyella antarctica TaxID=1577474 RepID=A0A1G6GE01_9ACTN|nr:DNA recombination protein RmuC [Raineyella antarctica]SDB79975.1 DNA recombination protein RmuC [Raineyella antarctica]
MNATGPDPTSLLLGIVIGLLAGLVVAALVALRASRRPGGADEEVLAQRFRALSADALERQALSADRAADQRMSATVEVLQPLQESVRQLQQRLTDVEKERVSMATDLRHQVLEVRSTGEQLRRETAALATALRKPQVRGAWGETQLTRIVEITGMVEHCDFDLQISITTKDGTLRPDMRVNLAGDRSIFVDSKVPLAAFLDATESDDEAVRDEQFATYARHVRQHVDQLGAKRYWRLAGLSPEFVVLFLPSDAFLAAALQRMPDLHEYASAREVVLATPATLIAMLKTIHHSWRQVALAESTAEVYAIARELYDRLATLGGHVDRMGRSLGSAVRSYNAAVGSLESRVLVSARRMRDLQVTQDDLVSPGPVEEPLRSVAAAELVEGPLPELFDGPAPELFDERDEFRSATRGTDRLGGEAS